MSGSNTLLLGLGLQPVNANSIIALLSGSTGNKWFVNPNAGSDNNAGGPTTPFQSLAAAQSAAVPNNDDIVYLVGGAASGAGSAYVSSSVLWAKDQVHLVGVSSGQRIGKRSRVAPLAGAAGFNNLVNVSAKGCLFSGIATYYGFANASSALVCWLDTGGRNHYVNCEFDGFGDATASTGTAALAGARAFLFNNNVGETTFEDCTFGVDTVARTATNYTLEIAGGAPRIKFIRCDFNAYIGSGGASGSHLLIGADGIDRRCTFRDCEFHNAVGSGATTMTQAVNLNGAAGGRVFITGTTMMSGATHWETSASGTLYGSVALPVAADMGVALEVLT